MVGYFIPRKYIHCKYIIDVFISITYIISTVPLRQMLVLTISVTMPSLLLTVIDQGPTTYWLLLPMDNLTILLWQRLHLFISIIFVYLFVYLFIHLFLYSYIHLFREHLVKGITPTYATYELTNFLFFPFIKL